MLFWRMLGKGNKNTTHCGLCQPLFLILGFQADRLNTDVTWSHELPSPRYAFARDTIPTLRSHEVPFPRDTIPRDTISTRYQSDLTLFFLSALAPTHGQALNFGNVFGGPTTHGQAKQKSAFRPTFRLGFL